MANVATTHLRAELNRHREGEYSYITIEHQCKRCHNLEGLNREKDFDSLMPAQEAPIARAMHNPSSLAAMGGCMALAPHLFLVV
jgi:hypothetical protein